MRGFCRQVRADLDSGQPADSHRLASPPPHVVAILARSLPHSDDPATPSTRPGGAPRVQVRACELHLLAAENERVRRFAEGLPLAAAAWASVSFDSPHMAKIMSAAMQAMMATLGMDSDSPIQSSMVDNALRRALAKLAKKVTGNRAADSLAEWMRLNLKD